ncbi:MAG: sel1 repeat family protein, partial [Holophaga sp.]|nr:sel1 repeat family protein [Holophaga sp.]
GFNFKNGIGVPRDEREAALRFRAAADAGDPLATYYLGVCYLRGLGMPLDEAAAQELFLLSAHGGCSAAQVILDIQNPWGDHYTGGDAPGSAAWYRRAALWGDPEAQFHLGYSHHHGLCFDEDERIPQDQAEAYVWITLAAENGARFAADHKDLVASHLSVQEVELAHERLRLVKDEIRALRRLV